MKPSERIAAILEELVAPEAWRLRDHSLVKDRQPISADHCFEFSRKRLDLRLQAIIQYLDEVNA